MLLFARCKGVYQNQNCLTPPLVIEVPVPSQESEQFSTWVLGVSILTLFLQFFRLDLETISKVWYFFFTFYYQNIFVEKKRKQVAQNMLINLLTLFVTSLMLWPAIKSASFNLAWCCPLRTLVHPVTFGVCIPTFNWARVCHVHLIYCLSLRPKTPHQYETNHHHLL